MANQKTLLSELRARSAIDCDTLDVEGMLNIEPCSINDDLMLTSFSQSLRHWDPLWIVHRTRWVAESMLCKDTTMLMLHNQAIVNIELQKPQNESLVVKSLQQAKQLYEQYNSEATFEQFASEVLVSSLSQMTSLYHLTLQPPQAVNLSARMLPYLTGRALIQTNPYNAYSTSATIANAKRIIAVYKTVAPDHPSDRVCIKIPRTWEGIAACKELEKQGIVTLATTLFSMEQAALAAAAGCSYIAPYVNELPVHFVPG